MGKEKQTTVVNSTSTTKPTPTPEETELNKLYLERERAAQPGMIQTQQQGLDLVSKLLAGQIGSLPEIYQQLERGITPEAIGTQASQMAAQYMPGFQQLGLSDSGTAYKETARGIANELLYPSEQFNIGAKQNLLNLALSGQAQVQSPVLAQGSTLANQLAGLRTINTQGTSNYTQTMMNPFLNSFQQSLGQTLGSPKFGMGPFSFGGQYGGK